MKQIVVNAYPFNPVSKTVDLSAIFGFTINRLYAIINLSQSQIIYATGIPGYGYSNITGNVVTLVYNTGSMNSSDVLQVVYDTVNTDIANAFVTKNTDGVNSQGYTAASEAKVLVTPLTNSSIVKAQLQDNAGSAITLGQKTSANSVPMVIASDQSPIPVTQSGAWTTGRTWDLSNSTDSVAAVQSGTWNINNITGAVSLPTGASTSALQTTANSTLASILANQTNGSQEVQVTNFPSIQAVSQSGTWTTGRTWDLSNTTDSVAAVQSGTWNISNITGSITLPTGAATSALQTTINTTLSSILANQTNGSQEVQVTNFPGVQAVSQSGTWTVNLAAGTIDIGKVDQGAANSNGASWWMQIGDTVHGPVAVKAASTAAVVADPSLVVAFSPNSPLPAGSALIGQVAQSGTWNITNLTNITGTISLPTGASTSANQGTANTSLASILANQTNGTQETQVTNFPAIQAVSQSGTWTVNLASGMIDIGKVDQGNSGTNAQAWWTQIGDTTHGPVAVKAASTAAAAADPSFVTAFSPNSPLPSGSNVIGSVAQSGAWNITNITGTVSLPTGAATSALQTTISTTLSSILANQTNGTQEVAQAGTWNINNITGTISLPTGAATAANQATANTSLASIVADMTNGTQVAQVADASGHIVTIKAASTPAAATDTSLVVALSPNSPLPAGSAIIGAVTQSGTWNIGTVSSITGALPTGTNTIGAVTQASGPWTQNITQFASSPVQTGTGVGGAGIPRVTVSSDSNILVTQSGTWTVGRSWTLASGSDSVSAVQSGTWNITNITGTVSLPTGASTSALQTTGNTSLSSIVTNQTNGTQQTQLVDGSGHLGTIKAASTAAAATDTSLVVALSPNSPIPAGTNVIGALSANQSVNLNQVAGSAVATAAAGIAKVGVTDGAGNAIGSTAVSANNYLDVIAPSEGATGSAVPVRTTQVGGSDGTNLRTFATDTAGNQHVNGDVASGSADSGNPVKVGAVFNSTMSAVPSGDRTNLQTDFTGSLSVVSRNQYKALSGAGTTVVKSGAGRLHTIVVTTGGGGFTITAYDNTAGSGTVIAAITNGTGGQLVTLIFDCEFTTGLTLVLAGGGNSCTVTYY